MKIRPAQVSDAPALHALNTFELGHAYELDKATAQLQRLLQLPHHILLIAEDVTTQTVLGYIHAEIYETLYFPALYNVLALVVKKEYHREGIGSNLLTALEQLAKERGLAGIRINSGIGRTDAHTFYQAAGYEDVVEQKRFLKFLHP